MVDCITYLLKPLNKYLTFERIFKHQVVDLGGYFIKYIWPIVKFVKISM